MKRIIAFVMIHNRKVIVEVTGVFKTSDGRKIASVNALPVNGKNIRPFTEYSMGGPVESSTTQIPVVFVNVLGIELEPEFAPEPAEVGSL